MRIVKEAEVSGTGPGAAQARPGWRRWAMAVTPWLAAAALGTAGWLHSRPAPLAAAATAAPSPAPTPDHVTSPQLAPLPPTSGLLLPPDVELAVIATARTTLGTAGLASDGPAPDRWPLEVRVVDVQDVGAGVGVATVHALVIERTQDGWTAPTIRAAAVPLRTGTSTAVLGSAWPLPSPPTPSTPDAVTSPAPDVGPEVVAPLESDGWTVDRVVSIDVVEVVDRRLLRLALSGTPPDETRAADHTVWLLDTPGGPRLLSTITTEEHP